MPNGDQGPPPPGYDMGADFARHVKGHIDRAVEMAVHDFLKEFEAQLGQQIRDAVIEVLMKQQTGEAR